MTCRCFLIRHVQDVLSSSRVLYHSSPLPVMLMPNIISFISYYVIPSQSLSGTRAGTELITFWRQDQIWNGEVLYDVSLFNTSIRSLRHDTKRKDFGITNHRVLILLYTP